MYFCKKRTAPAAGNSQPLRTLSCSQNGASDPDDAWCWGFGPGLGGSATFSLSVVSWKPSHRELGVIVAGLEFGVRKQRGGSDFYTSH